MLFLDYVGSNGSGCLNDIPTVKPGAVAQINFIV